MLIICEGEAICCALLFVAGVVLIVRFWSVVASNLDDVVDVIVHLYNFSGKEGASQGFVFLDGLLSFNFKSVQMSFKVEDQVEFYHGKLG